ncbi:TIGR02594 family protein [Novosphingobium sp. FSY-8]|uniref:TIGR02594 family protein n=1 Tax=Novosphingobium ovatum TaxID=1908523 RepID=A0ABW9XCR8_9SPHN|nr:TIGR02594 family protein [Novosphingobium ovatum]NBC36292.1 TIGR02594 family protein [Novosphingobium ovatum]
MASTLAIQQALAQAGYRPGPIDGIWGRQTIAALRLFQSAHGIAPDGLPGGRVMAALFPRAAPVASPLFPPVAVWVQEARRLYGIRETAGPASNPTILDWAGQMGIPYRGDDVAWCGLFVGHCISATLPEEHLPANVLGARAWGQFGIATPPCPGAVMVFWRKSMASGLGHVGFYAGEDEKAYRILGGNQSDSVSLAWIAKDRLVGARWPASVPAPIPAAVTVARDAGLSTNEA